MKKWVKKTGRKTLSLLICLAMLATVVLADDWYLEQGDIHISASESGQTVSQKRDEVVVSKPDANPVIHGSNQGPEICEAPAAAPEEKTPAAPAAPADPVEKPAPEDFKGVITVETKNGATANMTLSGVEIEADNRAGIEVGDADVNITVNGGNVIEQIDPWSDDAAIHVNSGSVTITGTEKDDVDTPERENLLEDAGSEIKESNDSLYVSSGEDSYGGSRENHSGGAAIGSNAGEDFSGKITIEGNVTVNADAGYGAAIGSGADSDVTADAEITMKDDAKVAAQSNKGAGIGSGFGGEEAQANAEVPEENELPSNENPHKMSGSISVTGNSAVIAESEEGAGIGSGALSEMNGSIHAGQHGKVWIPGSSRGAGIGSGYMGDVTGTITVDGNAAVMTIPAAKDSLQYAPRARWNLYGAGIGSGAHGIMNGSICLSGNSKFQLNPDDFGQKAVGIGGGTEGGNFFPIAYYMGKIFIGSGVSLNADGTPISIGAYQTDQIGSKQEIQQYFDLKNFRQNEKDIFAANPLMSSITIERGAHISGAEIQNHEDAHPYLHCMVDTERGKEEECFHYHVYIVDASKPSQPAEAAAGRLYWVTKDGKLANFAEERSGDVLTVISQDPEAEFHSTVYGLNVLLQRGIKTVIFKSRDIESSFDLQQVTEGQSGPAAVVLSHAEGKTCLTVGDKDLTDLLK